MATTRFIDTYGQPILAIFLAPASFNEMTRHAISTTASINAWANGDMEATHYDHDLTYSTTEDGEIDALHMLDAEGNSLLFRRGELPAVA